MLVACLLLANGEKEIRTFSTMTDDLLQLRDWLVAAQCTHVAIESTGVYWKPVFNILEDALTVILINPEHAHALAWAQDRCQRCGMAGGLVAPRFVETQFYSTAGDSRVARVDALSREHGAGAERRWPIGFRK